MVERPDDTAAMMNWSAIDPRTLAGRLVRLPARALPASMLMSMRRGPARGLKWISGSPVHGCWLSTHEIEKQAALQRFVRPGMTVYDIGARARFYTRVYAFEPCPKEARYLLEHVRLNQLSNVTVIHTIAADHDGLVAMSTDRGMTQNRICDDNESALMVSALTLDTAGLPPPPI